MRIINLHRFVAIWSLLLIVMLGAGLGAMAQGKHGGGGHPGGSGGGHPGGGGGGQPRVFNPGRQQMQRPVFQQRQQAQRPVFQQRQQAQRPVFQQRQPQQQQRQVMQPRYQPQPRFQRPMQNEQRAIRQAPRYDRIPQVQRQMPRFDRAYRAPQERARVEQPRQQMTGSPQFNRSEPNMRMDRRSEMGGISQQQNRLGGNRGWFGNEQRAGRMEGRMPRAQATTANEWVNNDRGFRNTGGRGWTGAPVNGVRGAMFGGPSFAGNRFNGQGYNGDRLSREERNQWRDNALRSVILNVGYANTGNGYYQYPGYATDYYAAPYYPDYYYDDSYAVYPDYYDTYDAAPEYYDFFDPYDEYYLPDYDVSSYYPDVYDDDLPLTLSIRADLHGGFSARLSGEIVAYGYDQGYSDGLYARSHHYGRQYYQDPYEDYGSGYADVVYGPYSYSISENRRCLSAGYNLGYNDAFSGRVQYDPYGSGDVDLVSMLVVSPLM